MRDAITVLQGERRRLETEVGSLLDKIGYVDHLIALVLENAAEPSGKIEKNIPDFIPSPLPRLAEASPFRKSAEWDRDDFRRCWGERMSAAAIGRRFGISPGMVYIRAKKMGLPKRAGGRRASEPRVLPRRRFETHAVARPARVNGLPADHPAITGARTLFPSTVVDPSDSPRLLVSGQNSRKIGDRVVKGPWAGMPIYVLTLEERATCPETCHHWTTCYGNGMPLARRHAHGPRLIERLGGELAQLASIHSTGFVVRLHQLGDFWSVDYVDAWLAWLEAFPPLRVFGYTAWGAETPIGAAVAQIRDNAWDRFAVRTSSDRPSPKGATTIWKTPETPRVAEGIVCPAQTGRTDCCGTCGLCWAPAAAEKTIVFIAHGQRFLPKLVATAQAAE